MRAGKAGEVKTLVEQIEESRDWARRYVTVMGDNYLTKLTAEELLSAVQPRSDIRITARQEFKRRLELVEKLQHAARKAAIDIVLLKERLEQCEADYKHCCDLNERMCYEVHDLKAAARAALEEK